MYLRSIILALIILVIAIYLGIRQYKEKGIILINILIGVVAALACLTYPLYDGINGISRVFCSILFALQSLTLGEDFELIATVTTTSLINCIYVILTYILYFGAPLLSASTILFFFGNTFSKLKFWLNIKKQHYIFSDINEKTVTLANKILSTNKNAKIIFTNKNKDNQELIKNRKILKFTEKINNISLHTLKKEKYLYFMSNSEEENLNECLEFLDKLKPSEKTKIYILNGKQEAYMIIDSMMNKYYENIKNNQNIIEPRLQIEIVNEPERIALERLNKLPLQSIFNVNRKEISVLIVGCGQFGQAFLKNIVWCFQVIGFQLKITVVEKNGENIKNKISLESPQLLKEYDINFICKDIETLISENFLKDINIDYAIVTAGADTNNFNIAIALRRYFLTNNQDNVSIDVLIRNTYKNKNISKLKNEDNKEYNINTFGSIEETYLKNSIIDLETEEMAKAVHSINWQDDKDLIEFYKSEYNRKSSRAVAVHLKYKLYSILLDKYTEDIETDLENYKELILDESLVKALAENEHNRWMAYMTSDGYKTATMKDVEKYYLKTGSHKHTLAKLHPALVPSKDLPRVEKQLENLIEKLTGKRVDKNLTKSDYEIVKRLEDIYFHRY